MEGDKEDKLPESRPEDDSQKVVPPVRRHLGRATFVVGSALFLTLLILAISVWQGYMKIPGQEGAKKPIVSSKVEITSLGEGAFGMLSGLSTISSGGAEDSKVETGTASQSSSLALPVGRGGGGATTGATVDMIYPYQPTYYVYVYKGDEFTQDQAKMDVLRRVVGRTVLPASAVATALDFDLFDLDKLGKARAYSLSFLEDKEFGYRTDIDLNDESVSIYKHWEKWPSAYGDCSGDVCTNRNALAVGDIPDDGTIIDATKSFLDEYKIDLSGFGTPRVNRSFLRYYASAAEAYVPDDISVTYPLVVEGKNVYESYGDLNGMSVSYDIRNRRVSSCYGLKTHNYQSSAYEAETDVAKLLAIAQDADGAMPLKDDAGTDYKTVELELGTPVLSYEILWRYENNQNLEYLVPCLMFPVRADADAVYARERVVVPLIKEFLDENSGGPIRIMEGSAAAAGSAISSAGNATVSGSQPGGEKVD